MIDQPSSLSGRSSSFRQRWQSIVIVVLVLSLGLLMLLNERLTHAGHAGLLEYPASWIGQVNASLVHGLVAANHPQLSSGTGKFSGYNVSWEWILPLLVYVILAHRLGNLFSFAKQPNDDCTDNQVTAANQHLDQVLGCIIVLALWLIAMLTGRLS